MSLKKNILKNGIASILQKSTRVLDQLLLVPFFISAWGAAYYGEWITLTIIPSILAFSDLGFGSAAANSFVLKYASGDKSEAADIAKTGFIIKTLTIIGGFLLTVAVLCIITQFDLLKNSLISTSDAVWALVFMMSANLLSSYTLLFEAYFRAARRAALSINFLTAGGALRIAVGICVLLMGYGVVAFALSQLITSVLFNLFYGYKAISLLGIHKEYSGIFDKKIVKDIVLKGFGFLMTSLWQVVLFQGTTLVVRLTLGPTAVAIFNTVRTLSRSVNQMYSIVNGSIFPELQYEIGAMQMDKARKIFRYSIKVVFLLSLFGITFLALFGLPIYSVWTHNELNPPIIMWHLFLVGIFLNAVWWTAGAVPRAVNKPYQLAVPGLIAAVLSVGCSYFFCLWWGLSGAAAGTLVFEIIMAFYIFPVSCKLLKQPIKEIFKFK